jgi:hypothetical protein
MLNKEQSQAVLASLHALYTRTQSDIANLSDRMNSLAQLVNELNGIVNPSESEGEVSTDISTETKKKKNDTDKD